jgi:inhibitor of KinA
MERFAIKPVGDGAVMALLDVERPDLGAVRRLWSIASTARAHLGTFALDVVPAYDSVLVRFDPRALGAAYVMAVLRGAVEHAREVQRNSARRYRIGVRFGDEYGEDLERTASDVGLKPATFIKQFCAAEYQVAFLGFIAGFPYLMGLPDALAAPRLASPRDRVPQGSVAIAGSQCGIYPRISPGGWRLLGRTSIQLFDPLREPAALLMGGDSVRFAAVRDIKHAQVEALR